MHVIRVSARDIFCLQLDKQESRVGTERYKHTDYPAKIESIFLAQVLHSQGLQRLSVNYYRGQAGRESNLIAFHVKVTLKLRLAISVS